MPSQAQPERPEALTHVLEEAERQALREVLDDEYRAWATHDQAIRDLGPKPPFMAIRDGKARHIEALRTLFQRYGLPVHENTWPGRVPEYASIHGACEAGIEAEIASTALYDRLMQTTSRADIRAVFEDLRRASREHHLPPLRRCLTRG
ncbi:MAG: DUF2202 domain-containing protein [Deltaproteobacteria bacterium]|nr:DUF2202 domain-containing protein [Deltaproteobacteria bacterium]